MYRFAGFHNPTQIYLVFEDWNLFIPDDKLKSKHEKVTPSWHRTVYFDWAPQSNANSHNNEAQNDEADEAFLLIRKYSVSFLPLSIKLPSLHVSFRPRNSLRQAEMESTVMSSIGRWCCEKASGNMINKRLNLPLQVACVRFDVRFEMDFAR